MFAGFPSVYLLYTTSVLFVSFLLRAGKKNDSRSTKLCDCCSSPVISCLNRQSALRHCREKHKKRLVNIPSTSLHFFLLSYQDSNLVKRYQKPVCYHYTIGQSQLDSLQALICGCKGKAIYLFIQTKLDFFLSYLIKSELSTSYEQFKP